MNKLAHACNKDICYSKTPEVGETYFSVGWNKPLVEVQMWHLALVKAKIDELKAQGYFILNQNLLPAVL